MKWSQTPIKTLRQAPRGAVCKSHILFLRSGFVHQLASGLFTYGPFMTRSVQKFSDIIREEMNRQGAVEIYMPMVQPKEIWEKTSRWEEFSEILQKMKNRSSKEFCLGPTHEEAVCCYVQGAVQSWRDLPFNVYQIQTKYRDEFRPRFGLLRAREFCMKDAYSFDLDKESALASFEKMNKAYHNIFSKIGVEYCVVRASSGAIGGDWSQEFHILAEGGEDRLLISEDGSFAVNMEIKEAQEENIRKNKKNIKEKRGIEAGHIFYLGQKYSQAMDISYLDRGGVKRHAQMGCYGIGISRILQAVIEQSHDEKGMIWPLPVAPFAVHLTELDTESGKSRKQAEKLYENLWNTQVDCFWDDRKEAPGVKFKDADLFGLPVRITLGPRDMERNQAEVFFRKSGEKKKLGLDLIVGAVTEFIKEENLKTGKKAKES